EELDVAREELGSLHGVPLYKCFVKAWPQVEAFQVRPADLLIATNPKSGTMWLSKILGEIYHNGDVEKCQWDAIVNWVPFLEMKAPKMSSTGVGVRVLGFTLLSPLSHRHRDAGENPVPTAGEDPSPGPAPPDLLPGQELQDNTVGAPPTLQDPRQEVQKILHFLGKEVVEGTVARMLHHTSLQEMRKNPAADYETMPTTLMDHSLSPFLWKGITGDWKNHFTMAQNKHFDQHYQEHMAGSNLNFQMEA
uniref:Sulfotransferase n=1 Tax=Buteo japonicus TaxID=224669 RepID=A0A8C0C3X2_9AVES